MAGDWIKLEHATLDKPEVHRIAELLGVSVDQALGVLFRFWVWLDRNSCNGDVTHMSRKSIDTVTHTAGFGACLIDVGWADFDENTKTLTITNFARHNGSTAKTRALTKDRVAESRKRSCNAPSVTREEKRREELRTNTITSSSPKSPANSDGVVELPAKPEKPSKLRQEATELLSFLNAKTDRFYRPTETTLRPIMARLKDGFSVGECKAVIMRKTRDWKGDDRMSKFLRPSTLFGDQKFAQYVGEVPPPEAIDG